MRRVIGLFALGKYLELSCLASSILIRSHKRFFWATSRLSGGHSSLDPLLPIPNRTVKRVCADASVQSHAKVGHRQAIHRKPGSREGAGLFVFAPGKGPISPDRSSSIGPEISAYETPLRKYHRGSKCLCQKDKLVVATATNSRYSPRQSGLVGSPYKKRQLTLGF